MATCVEVAYRSNVYSVNGCHQGVPNVYVRHDTWLRWLQLASACNEWQSVLGFCGSFRDCCSILRFRMDFTETRGIFRSSCRCCAENI